MGAGGGACRLSRVHAEGEHGCRLSRRGARAARAARLLLSAIRHAQRSHHRRDRGACRRTAPYEFQRLYGMGEALHREVVRPESLGKPCRIYAPVGGHGSCSPISCAGCWRTAPTRPSSTGSPTMRRRSRRSSPTRSEKAAGLTPKANPLIPRPPTLYSAGAAEQSRPAALRDAVREPLLRAMERTLAEPVQALGPSFPARRSEGGEAVWITSPQDRRVVVGECRAPVAEDDRQGARCGKRAPRDWDRLGGEARAAILDRAADLFEADRPALMALLVREAGKTLANAQGDLREAVDHLRYCRGGGAARVRCAARATGPTGERNELSLHGRGVFACISPWNFPLAIFTGQIAGALAAGNAVVAKPAEQTPLIAARAVQAAASRRRPGRRAASPAGRRRDGGRGAGRAIPASTASPSPAAPTPASPSTARWPRATGRSPS